MIPFILITVLLAAPCFASNADPAQETNFSALQVEPLPFPVATTTVKALSIVEIEAKIKILKEKIGGFPPRLKDANERQVVYETWASILLGAEALRKNEGDSERVLCALSELYRQGHNMDVEQSGARAKETIFFSM